MAIETMTPMRRMPVHVPRPIPDVETKPSVTTQGSLSRHQEPDSLAGGHLPCDDQLQSAPASDPYSVGGEDLRLRDAHGLSVNPSAEPYSIGEDGHPCPDAQAVNAKSSIEPHSGVDVAKMALHPSYRLPAAPEPDANGSEATTTLPPETVRIIHVIREFHRQRQDLLRAETRLTLQIKALCRRTVGYDPFGPAADQKRAMGAANALYTRIQRGGSQTAGDAQRYLAPDPAEPEFDGGEGQMNRANPKYGVVPSIEPLGEGEAKSRLSPGLSMPILFAAPCLLEARSMVASQRKIVEKMMVKHAEKLPVYEIFVKPIIGMGALGLAQIIGEAGDLSMYPNPAKLWKRMGLGLVGNERQRKVTDAAQALLHGYSPQRRSMMFVIGDSLLKKQNAYRDLYLARKQYEIEKTESEGLQVLPANKIKKGMEARSVMHVHRRSQRYVEKRLLRDLWRAWRGA